MNSVLPQVRYDNIHDNYVVMGCLITDATGKIKDISNNQSSRDVL